MYAFRTRSVRIRTLLLAVVATAFLPMALLAGVVVFQYSASERARAERQLLDSTDAMAGAIDAKFLAAESTLQALASSPALDSGDLAPFAARLRRATADTGLSFALMDIDGHYSIDTLFAEGVPLSSVPTDAWRARWRDLLATRKPEVTDVNPTPANGEPMAAIGVPVIRDGNIKWVLATRLTSKDFLPILEQSGMPTDWIVSIADRRGTMIARSSNNDQYAGKSLTPQLMKYLHDGGTGLVHATSLEGVRAVAYIAHAPASHWLAAVGFPLATLEGPLHRALRNLIAVAVGLAALALVLSTLAVRRINRSLLALSEGAEGVLEGKPLRKSRSRIAEIDTVNAILAEATDRLRAFALTLEAQVTARTAELSEANRRLVSEMKRREDSEAQVRHMQKLDALGRLTGGIAHDFNNMLMIVLNCLHLMRRRMQRGDADIGKYIDGAMQGAERAASLTSRLLAFGRRQPLSPEIVDVNGLVQGMADILRRTIPETIAIAIDLAPDAWAARIDPHGLDSAIVNIALNARDALPDGGRITIETANVCLRASEGSAADVEVPSGDYVVVSIADDGVGMPPDVLAQAFDPFFTTKDAGAGSGLGLSQVHGFMRQSGGDVQIASEPEKGTTVRLYLPRAEGEAERAEVGGETSPQRATGETVLVVEDEAAVRAVTVEMVRDLGYTVLEAADGVAGLAAIRAHPEIALLVTDVVMPRMNGRDLAEAALRYNRRLKVLLITGYMRGVGERRSAALMGAEVLTKPFTPDQLARKIGELFGMEEATG